MAEALAAWRSAFAAFRNDDEAARMGAMARKRAFARLEETGLPGRRDEYWKYTKLGAFAPPVPEAAEVALSADDPFDGIDAYRLFFVDGRLVQAMSDRDELAQIVDIAGPEGAPWLNRVFSNLQEAHTKVPRPMAELNMAFFTDGLAMRIPPGVKVDRPVHLVYLGTPANLRLEILIEEGAEVTVLESGAGALTTGAELLVEANGSLHHIRAQTERTHRQFTNMFAQLSPGASFKSFTLSSDADLVRNETILTFKGEDANGHIAAALMARGRSHIDNTVYISHEAANCESRQVIKSVLDEAATGVFQGKIFVAQEAQKTDGYQISQSTLLSEAAEFNAKPELEIYADDVICSHGSTTGAIDEDALFYLRSRGVPEAEAQGMLITAFLDDAIEEVESSELRRELRRLVALWMQERSGS